MANRVSLSDVCDFLDNQRKPITAKDRSLGVYPYYGANGVLDYVDNWLFDEELVLLAEDGGFFDDPSRGVAYRVSGKCWVNNHAHVLRPKNNINVDYLGYVLRQYDVRPFVTGATVKKITQKSARHIQIPLPQLDEQKRIVEFLEKTESLRKRRNESLALTSKYTESMFIKMFGNPVTNPMRWETQKFENLGKLDRGKSKHRPRNDPELLGGEHPLIQTGDVAKSDTYIEKYTSTYSDIGLNQSRKWPKGTLCITIAANIAKTGILTFDACFPDSVVGFTADITKTNSAFIHYWMSFFQKILEASAPESAQKNINLRILRELKVITPPIELQDRFKEIVDKSEKIKNDMILQRQQLDNQFNGLMQNAFKTSPKSS